MARIGGEQLTDKSEEDQADANIDGFREFVHVQGGDYVRGYTGMIDGNWRRNKK